MANNRTRQERRDRNERAYEEQVRVREQREAAYTEKWGGFLDTLRAVGIDPDLLRAWLDDERP